MTGRDIRAFRLAHPGPDGKPMRQAAFGRLLDPPLGQDRVAKLENGAPISAGMAARLREAMARARPAGDER